MNNDSPPMWWLFFVGLAFSLLLFGRRCYRKPETCDPAVELNMDEEAPKHCWHPTGEVSALDVQVICCHCGATAWEVPVKKSVPGHGPHYQETVGSAVHYDTPCERKP